MPDRDDYLVSSKTFRTLSDLLFDIMGCDHLAAELDEDLRIQIQETHWSCPEDLTEEALAAAAAATEATEGDVETQTTEETVDGKDDVGPGSDQAGNEEI